MRKVGLLFLVAISAFLAGCPVRSLQPLFTEKDAAFIPALVGTWIDGEDRYTFKKMKGNEYEILLCEHKSGDSTNAEKTIDDTAVFIGQAGQLGKTWFLDTYPAREIEDFHLLPTHIISKLWFEGDTLRLASLEGDWLRKEIAAGHLKVQHALVNADIILTGSTSELQEIVKRFASDENAFPNAGKFVRMK